MVTASFSSNMKIEPVLASVVTLAAFQTIAVKFGEISNGVGASKINAALSSHALDNFIWCFVIVGAICFIFYKIMDSECGLAIRVYGDGVIIAESLGINSRRVLSLGLATGNGMAAAAGALIAQSTGSFSPSMGMGSFVFGIGSIVISERFLEAKNIRQAIVGCIIASLIFRAIIELITRGGSQPLGTEYSTFIEAFALVFFLALVQEHSRKKSHIDNI